jgi:hypothetical protein
LALEGSKDKRQSDSQTPLRPFARRIHLLEKVENPRQHDVRNLNAVVTNPQYKFAVALIGVHLDAASVGRIFRGVNEEVADDLREPERIAFHTERVARKCNRQLVVGGVDRRPGEFDALLDARRDVYNFRASPPTFRRNTANLSRRATPCALQMISS